MTNDFLSNLTLAEVTQRYREMLEGSLSTQSAQLRRALTQFSKATIKYFEETLKGAPDDINSAELSITVSGFTAPSVYFLSRDAATNKITWAGDASRLNAKATLENPLNYPVGVHFALCGHTLPKGRKPKFAERFAADSVQQDLYYRLAKPGAIKELTAPFAETLDSKSAGAIANLLSAYKKLPAELQQQVILSVALSAVVTGAVVIGAGAAILLSPDNASIEQLDTTEGTNDFWRKLNELSGQ